VRRIFEPNVSRGSNGKRGKCCTEGAMADITRVSISRKMRYTGHMEMPTR
jgi:hypothetical protein